MASASLLLVSKLVYGMSRMSTTLREPLVWVWVAYHAVWLEGHDRLPLLTAVMGLGWGFIILRWELVKRLLSGPEAPSPTAPPPPALNPAERVLQEVGRRVSDHVSGGCFVLVRGRELDVIFQGKHILVVYEIDVGLGLTVMGKKGSGVYVTKGVDEWHSSVSSVVASCGEHFRVRG
jgi:hypothetical protein